MRRTLVIAVAALGVIGAGAAAALLRSDDSAPLPSHDELRARGFAVWPQDTLTEAMRTCSDPESWQLKARDTAGRFAIEVLKYREPSVTRITEDTESSATEPEYLIDTDDVRGVHLGSAVDLRKYGRCWFIVRAEPREGYFLPTVAFAHNSGKPQLVINGATPRTQVGYGEWEEEIEGDAQVVLDLPEPEPDATGHVMGFGAFRNVVDVTAAPLGFVPEPATVDVARVTVEELARTDGICRSEDAFRTPRAALADLYTWTFDNAIPMQYGKWIFRGKNHIEPMGGDRWLLKTDDAELQATVPSLKKNCWRVSSVTDETRDLLKSLRVAEDSFTFELRWGKATSASLTLASTGGGDTWDLERLEAPITVSRLAAHPLREPFYVSVVLRDTGGRRVVSAHHSWYQTR